MTTRSILTTVSAAAVLFTSSISFAGRPGGWFGPEDIDYSSRHRHCEDEGRESARPVRSDYLPQYSRAYRLGYEWGARDAAYGFRRDYVRAYRASGCCYESYFQEGYWQGFEGMPRAH